jgi:peptide deformylase
LEHHRVLVEMGNPASCTGRTCANSVEASSMNMELKCKKNCKASKLWSFTKTSSESGGGGSCKFMQSRIVKLGHPVLRQKCAVKPVAEALNHELLQSLTKIMRPDSSSKEDYATLGIAAPQLGFSERMFVIFQNNTALVEGRITAEKAPLRCVIEPEILNFADEEDVDWEMCLSIPGFIGLVKRPRKVTVAYWNENGDKVQTTLKNLGARVFQHEYDHLDGVLFIDRLAHPHSLFHMDEYNALQSAFSVLSPKRVLKMIEQGSLQELIHRR